MNTFWHFDLGRSVCNDPSPHLGTRLQSLMTRVNFIIVTSYRRAVSCRVQSAVDTLVTKTCQNQMLFKTICSFQKQANYVSKMNRRHSYPTV